MRFWSFIALGAVAYASPQSKPAPSCGCSVANVHVEHEGKPVGQMNEVNGIQTYISYPADKKTDYGILYLPDAFGFPLVQNRLLADSFAKAGYVVVGPDFFEGEPAPHDLANPNFDYTAWLARHPADKVDKIIENTIKYMKTTLGVKKIGAVGYCFGGRFVARFLAKDKGLDAGFTAHPSLVTNEELQAVSGPFSIGAAENDIIFTTPKRHEAEGILSKSNIPFQISLYGSTAHGFGVRGNMTNKREKYAKEEAYLQAVRWFDTWLKDI
ncbi:dienelactone hydrolase family protein [Microthyrium microscopicum]|uniref:Dienelactone hydrolase family protein n=1 Tax=Microthyrium microscopicum TaxID=703497 RepID=A0A6A6U1D4_9PEZI|nr:dienelactone hydrolase family protein [Microthyrium microscopicum]